MRACCNKKEDNFITYHQNREKEIDRVREWEKLNPEKRKEYTIKYYKTERGHRKRLAQQKRYREKKKLIQENEKLKKDKMELLLKVDDLQSQLKKQKEIIDNLKQYIQDSSLEVATKEYGMLTVCNSDDLLQILEDKEGKNE